MKLVSYTVQDSANKQEESVEDFGPWRLRCNVIVDPVSRWWHPTDVNCTTDVSEVPTLITCYIFTVSPPINEIHIKTNLDNAIIT